MLQVRNLCVSYGVIQAVQDVSLDIAPGEVVCLVGANGAGKSSVMNGICGIVKPASGQVTLQGQAIHGWPAHRILRRGLAYVPEGRMIFAGLTVRENLLLGGLSAGHNQLLSNQLGLNADQLSTILPLFPILQERLHEPASTLSGGQAQLLAIARGLMSNPTLLLLDEPSLGLAPLAARQIFDLIQTLGTQGLAVLLVEQNVRQALQIAHRGYVLEQGRITLQGTADELVQNEHLVRAYLGVDQR
ncbi:MAG: ABC transporter ATP-binding protein [Chloroflexota bacterium]